MFTFIRRAIDFVRLPSHSRTLGIIIFFIFITIISLTVYVAQQQQQLKQRAAEPAECSGIDSISPCPANPSDCSQAGAGALCKTGNTIYKCVSQ